MGIVRWRYRVAVYVSLMRDDYPPFRMDLGGRYERVIRCSPSYIDMVRRCSTGFSTTGIGGRRIAHATGRLLMVGLGPGTDLKFVPPAVTSVAAVEPVAVFRRMASRVALRHGITADIVDGTGESIPVSGQQLRLGPHRAGVVFSRRCRRDAARDPARTGARWQAGGPRACPRRGRGGPVPGPGRQTVVLVGRGLRAEPPTPSTPSPRPDLIPADCAASAPRCRSRANPICRVSPPFSNGFEPTQLCHTSLK